MSCGSSFRVAAFTAVVEAAVPAAADVFLADLPARLAVAAAAAGRFSGVLAAAAAGYPSDPARLPALLLLLVVVVVRVAFTDKSNGPAEVASSGSSSR